MEDCEDLCLSVYIFTFHNVPYHGKHKNNGWKYRELTILDAWTSETAVTRVQVFSFLLLFVIVTLNLHM